MDKLILFNKNATINDLINNINTIAVIDDISTNAIINYSIDSKHIITVNIDSYLGEEIINKTSKHDKVIIKALSLENNYEYFMCNGSNNDIDNTYELVGLQITIEWMSNMFIIDAKPRGLNSNLMLKHLREATEEYKQGKQFAKDFILTGDIDIIKNCNVWHDNFNNALSDLQELYGGEVRRKGFEVALLYKTGRYENPVYEVNYGDNLLSCNIERDFNNIIYGVLPKGYDSLYGDIQYSEKITEGITIEKEYNIRVKESDTEEDDENYVYFNNKDEAIAELNRLAKAEFELNKIDEFKITYDINYLDLSTVDDSTEKTYLQVGDLVRTNISKLGLSVDTRVISFNYNILTEEIEDVTLSNNAEAVKVPTINAVANELTKRPTKEESTSITKLESTNILNSGLQNSYATTRKIYNEDGTVIDSEILVMDSPNIENATNVWRWNKNGLMHSNDGYAGKYHMGMRYDGVIFADLIRAGILKSLNGESWINLDNGDAQLTGTIITKSGDKYVSLNSGGISFQDNFNKEQILRIATSFYNSNRATNGVNFSQPKNADYIRFSWIDKEDLTSGWDDSVSEYSYFDLCSRDFTTSSPYYKGMNVRSPLYLRNLLSIKSNNENSQHQIYNNSSSKLALFGDSGIILGYRENATNKARLYINKEETDGCSILSYGNWNFNGGAIKNANIINTYTNLETKSSAEVSLLSTNTTDNVRYIYKDITSKDNKIILNIPNEYQGRRYEIVGVAKKVFGDYAIVKEEESRFIIETDREMTMNIEISIE